MTENKRFKYYEHKGADYILENPNEDLDFIEMLGDCLEAEEIVNRLNKLYNENERLKSDIKYFEITYEVEERGLDCVPEMCTITSNTPSRKELFKENKQLKKELNKLKKFEHGGEHIRLSINIETGELQRHIYATGQWFGDFDRVLVDNWLSKENYQKFINRIIEVYNTEFKKELE